MFQEYSRNTHLFTNDNTNVFYLYLFIQNLDCIKQLLNAQNDLEVEHQQRLRKTTVKSSAHP